MAQDNDNEQTEVTQKALPATAPPPPVGLFTSHAVFVNQIMFNGLGPNVRLTGIEQIGNVSFERGALVMPIDVAIQLAKLLEMNLAPYMTPPVPAEDPQPQQKPN